MTAQEATDQFVAKYNGQYIDEDKYYGSQCWDVVARYAREMWGCSPFPTISGGAEGLYRFYAPPIPIYFDKVSRDQLAPGDIVVWSADFYPPYGHTALAWHREGDTLFVLEQDGSKDPNGDGNADGVSYIAQRAITSKVAGGLRPKGGYNNDMLTLDAKFMLYRSIMLVDPTPEQATAFKEQDDNEFAQMLYNNAGKFYRQRGDALVVNDIRAEFLKQIGTAVALDPDKDGLEAIVAKVKTMKPGNYKLYDGDPLFLENK